MIRMCYSMSKQVAQYLQLKESTIYSWAQDGKIPAIRLGVPGGFAVQISTLVGASSKSESDEEK